MDDITRLILFNFKSRRNDNMYQPSTNQWKFKISCLYEDDDENSVFLKPPLRA